LGNHTQ